MPQPSPRLQEKLVARALELLRAPGGSFSARGVARSLEAGRRTKPPSIICDEAMRADQRSEQQLGLVVAGNVDLHRRRARVDEVPRDRPHMK